MDKNSKTSTKNSKKNQQNFYAKHQKITRYITTRKRKATEQTQEQTQEKNPNLPKRKKIYTQEKLSSYFAGKVSPTDAPT